MSARRRVHVVVTCTNRKTRQVPADLHLRRVTGVRTGTRTRTWTTRLGEHTAQAVPAEELYAGEHWQMARRLPAIGAEGLTVSMWVCSAGYGLISFDTPVKPYAATFAAGHPDSVPGGREDARAWWDALADWKPGTNGAPRSIRALAAADRGAAVMLVLSAAYLSACRADVLAATDTLADPDRLTIISAGSRNDADLDEWLVPVDARLQHALGGARQSLNIRVARRLLADGVVDRGEARDQIARTLAVQPPLPTYNRTRMTDSEVRAYVRQRLHRDPDAARTLLLRELRDSGHACEQSRFARLFAAERRVTA